MQCHAQCILQEMKYSSKRRLKATTYESSVLISITPYLYDNRILRCAPTPGITLAVVGPQIKVEE